ncbi:restriction endonuclease subunit S, partial [Akkermansiaceae bacterium]|nr:restriction endonuclease subunit S [Akkermansiaceae bacterium]
IPSKTTDENKGTLAKNDLIMPERDIGVGLIIGRVAMVKMEKQYILGANLLSLRAGDGFSPAFLHQYINSGAIRPTIRRLVNGSAQLMITSKEVKKVASLFPPRDEQTKIADFFSAIDQKIESVSEQIAKTQTFKKGLLQQMFV